MKKLLVLLLLTASAFAQCGVELKAKKTMQDSDVSSVDTKTVSTYTVKQLSGMTAPNRADIDHATKRFPIEKQTIKVTGLFIGFKLESDSDFHIVIADPKDRTKTMIVEIPSPSCLKGLLAVQAKLMRLAIEAKYGKATPKFKKIPNPQTVTVVGIGFIDFIHGQTGVAPDGYELHPVTQITWTNN